MPGDLLDGTGAAAAGKASRVIAQKVAVLALGDLGRHDLEAVGQRYVMAVFDRGPAARIIGATHAELRRWERMKDKRRDHTAIAKNPSHILGPSEQIGRRPHHVSHRIDR